MDPVPFMSPPDESFRALPPKPWEGFLLVGLCVTLFTVGAALVQGEGMVARFLILPAVAFLAPSVAWVLWRGGGREAFPLRRPTFRQVFVAAALAMGGSLLALSLAGFLSGLPGAQREEPALRALLLSAGPLWRFLFFALAPALCEEALFRGAFLWAIRPWGATTASVVSGLAFAAVHGSWLKFLPVAILGWALAQVVLRTGNIGLAVAGHALHNAAILGIVSLGAGMEKASFGVLLLAALAGLVAIGLGVVCRWFPRESEPG